MAIAQRGQIVTPDRARQIRDFSGLLFGTITPTDIDGLIEYHGKGYIIIEVKLSGARVPDGQHKALERLTDVLWRAKRLAICIVATHNTVNVEEPIDVANAIVHEYRYMGMWRHPQDIHTVRELAEWFMAKLEKTK